MKKTPIDYKVSFTPTQKQVEQIERWLIRERDETDEGFYCNWDIIVSAHQQKELAIISAKKKTIGFVVWSARQYNATIDIMEVQPSQRNKGIGRYLFNSLIAHLLSERIVVVDLQCSPPSSEPVWRQLGFVDFPDDDSTRDSNTWLYKILVPYLKPSSTSSSKETLELWDTELHQALKDSSSTWSWKLSYKRDSRELTQPIIHPARRDWRIRWKINNQILKDDKIKYFDKVEIDYGKFIIIEQMPEVMKPISRDIFSIPTINKKPS